MKTRQFSRPRIVVSKCIEFDRCRYNGEMVPSEFVRRLMDYADFIPVCMEVEIGLGVPRDPIRVVQVGDALRLVQPSTGKDVTELASSFSSSYLDGLPEVDGFLLKSRSPSCGIKDVKVYPMGEKVASLTAKESGFFGREVMLRFRDLAIEDEARLIEPPDRGTFPDQVVHPRRIPSDRCRRGDGCLGRFPRPQQTAHDVL